MPMELDLGPEAEAFREELRGLIAEAAPERGEDGRLTPDGEEAWEGALLDARLVCPSWPEEHGGRGLDGVRLAVMNEELGRARLPRINRGMGESLVGPAIIVHGTPEQQRAFLPRIICGEDIYCQGFSEPDAGSDLASLKTRGEVVDGEVIISGQKVWTSGYWRANMLFCLCRTDPDAPKHQGISYVLVPIRHPDGSSNGIEFRPIKQISGESHFAETFLEGARAPVGNVIGGLNGGWRVAMTTLGNERGGGATTQHLRWERAFWRLTDEVRSRGKAEDPLVRQSLAWCFMQVHAMKANGLRTISALAEGHDPGPGASLTKMFWSEYSQAFTEIATDILGAPSIAWTERDGSPSRWTRGLLANRAHTIWGGTAEVQRNIAAERVLGLPKDPARDLDADRT